MENTFICKAPTEYLLDHIAMAYREITFCRNRAKDDPTSAPYMRECTKFAISRIRLYRAELESR